jgi:hypothetical protein
MRCRVNVFVTQTMIEETWLRSCCLAMEGRSDSDIPAFSGTPQYCYMLVTSDRGWINNCIYWINMTLMTINYNTRISYIISKLLQHKLSLNFYDFEFHDRLCECHRNVMLLSTVFSLHSSQIRYCAFVLVHPPYGCSSRAGPVGSCSVTSFGIIVVEHCWFATGKNLFSDKKVFKKTAPYEACRMESVLEPNNLVN